MAVQLSFQDQRVRQQCESPISARRAFGPDVARTLHTRLADLRAADSVYDLLSLRLARLHGSHPHQIFIQLGGGYVLHAQAGMQLQPSLSSGERDWKQVSRLKILFIERANEN